MARSSLPVGSKFLNKFKIYLEKLGLSKNKINEIGADKISSIFLKSDPKDGKEDGNVTGKDLLSILKEEYEDDNITMDDLSQEYIDAWKELAGEDNILNQDELSEEEEIIPDSSVEQPSGGNNEPSVNTTNIPRNNNDNNDKSEEVQELTAANLEGKDASTLRSERNDVIGQLDDVRSKMKSAQTEKKTDVDKKKSEYDTALKELADVSEYKDENDKTLKDLESEKNEQESKITNKETEIGTINDNINTTKGNITSIQGQIDSLKEPNKSDYTTTDEKGEAAYRAALEEYNSKKERLNQQLNEENDKLSSLEQQLITEENALKELETALNTINDNIGIMAQKIAQNETANKELAAKVKQTLTDYQTANQELSEIKAPYEVEIAKLGKNLSVYDTAIEKTEKYDKEEKDKWSSDIEDEQALEYKNKIDELYGYSDEEPDPSKKGDLQGLLESSLNDKNISVEDKMKLLAYAKSKDKNAVIDMLKNDTFFVKAFAEIADDENSSTERLLAMQDVYFDIQGDNEVSSNVYKANGELQGSYVEAQVSLIEKAIKNGNLDKVIKNFEKHGMSVDSLKEIIETTNEYTDEQKNELLNRLNSNNLFDEKIKGYELKTFSYAGRNYIAHIPIGLEKGDKCALYLHLHGHLENNPGLGFIRGAQFSEGIRELAENDKLKNCKTIFIQPYSGTSWETDKNVKYLDGLMEDFINNSGYNIDTNNITLGGHSCGTGGAINYYLNSSHKDWYSKIALMSIANPNDVNRIKDIDVPIALFTATGDGKNCIKAANIINVLKKSGQLSNVSTYTMEGGHGQICRRVLSGYKQNCNNNNEGIPDLFKFLYN